MQVQVYLGFNGRCEEAVRFYQEAVGAEVQMLMRHKDSPEPAPPGMLPAGSENKIMHVAMKIGDSTVMATDGSCSGKTNFDGFSLSLQVSSADVAQRAFARLADGGKTTMPLTKTFFAPLFGMVVDRFGVSWMVLVPA